ncbi:MAG: pilus assembly protein TadB, partial [Actinomycetota bacterium]|nr:pilus assembly protein TadB [Actinomycetota bacterium]
MTALVQGALIGAVGGLGLVLVVGHVRARRVRLDDRLAPYLRPARTTSRLLAVGAAQTPLATVQRLLATWMADGVRLVTRFGAPSELVRSRLVRAGRSTSVEQFRAEQVVGGALGLLGGLVLATLVVLGRGMPLPSLFVMVVAASA